MASEAGADVTYLSTASLDPRVSIGTVCMTKGLHTSTVLNLATSLPF